MHPKLKLALGQLDLHKNAMLSVVQYVHGHVSMCVLFAWSHGRAVVTALVLSIAGNAVIANNHPLECVFVMQCASPMPGI